MINQPANGLICLCLLLLSGCSATPSKVTINTVSSCPSVTPCRLSPVTLSTNRDLVDALVITENDWAHCAAQIHAIVDCQANDNEEIKQP